jgi:hypothetical protein
MGGWELNIQYPREEIIGSGKILQKVTKGAKGMMGSGILKLGTIEP